MATSQVYGSGFRIIPEGDEVWEDLRVGGLATERKSDPPDIEVFRDGLQANAFDTTTLEQVYFELQLPHGWLAGSSVSPHIHWGHNIAVPEDNKGVVWGLEYSWGEIGETFGASNTIYSTDDWVTAPVQYQHNLSEFADISGAGKTLSSMLMCRLFRNVASGDDDFAHDAFLFEFDLHVQMNSLGSRQEYVK